MSTIRPISGGDGPEVHNEREDLHNLAKLAASCRRFDHMFEYMKRLVEVISPDDRLTVSERQSFGFACYAHIKVKFDAYDYVAKIAISCHRIDQKRSDAAVDYMAVMAEEIDEICREVVEIINANLLNPIYARVLTQLSVESAIFYNMMKGDFLRKLAIVSTSSENLKFADEAYASYLAAKRDENQLPVTNPTRLDSRFRLADFLCSIYQKPYEGYKMAREAYEMAMRELKATGQAPSAEIVMALNRLKQLLFRYKDYAN